MIGPSIAAAAVRARPKVAVIHVASAKASVANATSLGVVIPTVQDGDFAVFATNPRAGGAVTGTYTGTALLWEGNVGEGGGGYLRTYTKTLTAAESGATATFSFASSGPLIVMVSVYRYVGGYSIRPASWVGTSVERLNGRPPRFPSVICGPSDMIVGIAGIGNTSSLSQPAALVDTVPSGMTLRQAESKAQNPGFSNPVGLAIMDGPGNGTANGYVGELRFGTQVASNPVGVIFVLSPVGPRWTEAERTPTTIAALSNISVYSHSLSVRIQKPELNWGYNSRSPYGRRLANAMYCFELNRGLGGARIEDIASYMFGNALRYTEAAQGDPIAVANVQGTWTVGQSPLVVLDVLFNSASWHGSDAQGLTSGRHAVRAMLRRLRAGAIYDDTHASVTATGTWTTLTSSGVSAGAAKQSTVPGSKIDISVTDVPALDLVVLATDNADTEHRLYTTGSTYAVKVDGVTVATGTTHNQSKYAHWEGLTGTESYGFCQMVIPVTGIPAGTHTVTLEHTGSSGHGLVFDSWHTPAATPPWICAIGIMSLTSGTMTAVGITQADLDAYDAMLLEVIAEENVGGRILHVPIKDTWDPVNYVCSDGVHQNELGMAVYVKKILKEMNRRIP